MVASGCITDEVFDVVAVVDELVRAVARCFLKLPYNNDRKAPEAYHSLLFPRLQRCR